MPRNDGLEAAGRDVVITKNVPNKDGTRLKGAKARAIGDPYKSQQGGEDYQIVQLDQTNGVLGVPVKSLGGTRCGVSFAGLVSAERWNKLFGRRRKGRQKAGKEQTS